MVSKICSDLLLQIPLASSGSVPYLEFLSRFGGIDLNVNIIRRGGMSETNCYRTLKELEVQVGEKVFRNMKTIIKAFELLDVNKTGLVQPQELRRVLETFCLKMTDEEYKRFSKHYNINKDSAVDYNVFLKNLGLNNDLNLRHFMGHQEISRENQQAKTSRREHLPGSVPADSIWDTCSLEDIERTFCREVYFRQLQTCVT
uniref:EF-hand calcium binding domain 6 n=1 Tax=Sciurus vulgaris TaxID=55149 RepID=A0A8D2AT05_SCIVU